MWRSVYRWLRLLPKRRKEPYATLYKILNFYPYHIDIYEQAFVHRSSTTRLKDGKWINNERLEFLGDAILDAVVADIVFKQFEMKKEGFLTDVRAKIVSGDSLNRMAIELGLPQLIKSAPLNTSNTHIYGNALEALIGAIYLDYGYRRAKKFIYSRLIEKCINLNKMAKREINFKSRLLEWGQKNRIPVTFQLIDSSMNNERSLIFTSAVYIAEREVGRSTGYSKRESHQKAAKIAWKKVKYPTPEFEKFLSNLYYQAKQNRYNNGDTIAASPSNNNH